jgi:hypothetical protein
VNLEDDLYFIRVKISHALDKVMRNEFFGRLGKRYWMHQISLGLSECKQKGVINNEQLHTIDHRIKYTRYGR